MKLSWGKSLYPLAENRITSGALEINMGRLVVQPVQFLQKYRPITSARYVKAEGN
jgi:hypothetical protein